MLESTIADAVTVTDEPRNIVSLSGSLTPSSLQTLYTYEGDRYARVIFREDLNTYVSNQQSAAGSSQFYIGSHNWNVASTSAYIQSYYFYSHHYNGRTATDASSGIAWDTVKSTVTTAPFQKYHSFALFRTGTTISYTGLAYTPDKMLLTSGQNIRVSGSGGGALVYNMLILEF